MVDQGKRVKSIVASIVVLYNPDVVKLHALIQSLLGQVQRLYVVDNTEGRESTHSAIFKQYEMDFEYIPLGKNLGIATAQNAGITKALSWGASDILLLDQDSVLPPGMVQNLLIARQRLIDQGIRVAAIAPAFIDDKTGETGPAIRHSLLRVNKVRLDRGSSIPVLSDYVISSGSMINAGAFGSVGLMRDELFIDWVDIEWGLRAKKRGLQCFVVPNVLMRHSIGDDAVDFLGKSINLHHDVRHYYIVRNATYLLKCSSMGVEWRTVTLVKIPLYIVFYSWHARCRISSFLLLLRALFDGVLGRTGRLES